MDMSRASACSYALHDRGLDTALGVIAGAGFQKVDLWGRPPHFSTRVTEVKPRDIERKAAKHGVQIANLGTYPGRQFLDAERSVRHAEMNDLTRTVDLAVRFGARSIRISPGLGVSPEIAAALIDPFSRAAVYAASKGICMGMENHAGSIAGVPDLALALSAGVESRYFGVLYEPCNLLGIGVDYKAAFEMLKDWIVHVHLKDGRWVDGDFQCCHPGDGEVDLPWVMEALASIGYQGDYAIEYEAWEIEPVETGLARWYQFFENL
jgi:sugar phosphate isomerase/epimerase